MTKRVYLDWNATAPLRAQARMAMSEAMDLTGNPSSVHAEGRAAKALMERARGQVLETLGAVNCDLVFTSGATEAAALALAGRGLASADVEHDAVAAWGDGALAVDGDGRVAVPDPAKATLQLANSETGVVQDLPDGLAVSDLTQGFGKLAFGFEWLGVNMGFVSAHKIGGPKGVGALVFPRGTDIPAQIKGGGQEQGWRAGTENLVGIAGFAAAAEVAQNDLAAGIWEEVATRRDMLEEAMLAEGVTIAGHGAKRLPNTSLLLTPCWKGETQVMLMDLAGFAVSSGSACSSGKVKESRGLKAMGYTDAGCALRVSIGPSTTSEEILRFVESYTAQRKKALQRAA